MQRRKAPSIYLMRPSDGNTRTNGIERVSLQKPCQNDFVEALAYPRGSRHQKALPVQAHVVIKKDEPDMIVATSTQTSKKCQDRKIGDKNTPDQTLSYLLKTHHMRKIQEYLWRSLENKTSFVTCLPSRKSYANSLARCIPRQSDNQRKRLELQHAHNNSGF